MLPRIHKNHLLCILYVLAATILAKKPILLAANPLKRLYVLSVCTGGKSNGITGLSVSEPYRFSKLDPRSYLRGYGGL